MNDKPSDQPKSEDDKELETKPDPLDEFILKNQIPQRVEISGADGPEHAIQIPPYGERVVAREKYETLALKPWLSRGIIAKHQNEPPPVNTSRWTLAPFLPLFYGGLIGGIWEAVGTPPALYWPIVGVVSLLGLLVGIVVLLRESGRLNAVVQLAAHLSSLGIALVLAFGVPSLVIFFGGAELEPVQKGLSSWLEPRVGKFIQVLFIGIVSLLPALLFFLFDRQKLSTLREGFFRSVVLLDPELRTLEDAQSVYGNRADEVLGRCPKGDDSVRLAPNKRLMVVVTTVVVSIGWTLALAPAAAKGSTVQSLPSLFTPTPDLLVYAFLGAYVFGAGMLFRRYVRSDLKPSAFAQMTVRIISAILIAWAFSMIWSISSASEAGQAPSGLLLAIAFMIGFVPETGLTAIFEFIRNRSWVKRMIPSLEEKFPLEQLDGINIYHRSRLIDEGIENMENLAHADLIELMLQTRIPLATLVDWIDQSILYLHVGVPGTPNPEDTVENDALKLRSFGIRTATDLQAAFEKSSEQDAFLAILPSEGEVTRLRVVLDALSDDEWFDILKGWRRAERYKTVVLKEESLSTWDAAPRPLPISEEV